MSTSNTFDKADAKLLVEIGNRLTSSTVDLHNTLQAIINGANQLTHTDTGVIYIIDTDESEFTEETMPTITLHHPLDYKHPGPRLWKKDGLTRTTIHSGRTWIISDLEKCAQAPKELKELYKSVIAVPLKLEDRVIGVLYVNSVRKRRFRSGEVELLEMLATQAAVAVNSSRLQAEVERNRKRFETLFRNSPVATFLVDPNGKKQAWQIVECNAAASDMTGYAVGELTEMSIDALHSHSQKSQARADHLDSSRGISPSFTQATFRKKDGSPILVEITSASIEIDNREYVLYIDQDVTKLRLQTLVSSSPVALIAVNEHNQIMQFNDAAEHILGYSHSEVIGQDMAICFRNTQEATRINQLLQQNVTESTPIDGIRVEMKHKSGEQIPVRLSGVYMTDESGDDTGSLFLLTDLRRLENMADDYPSQQEFLNYLQNSPQDISISSLADLSRYFSPQMQRIRKFCRAQYTVLFASTAEEKTVLEAVAWAGIGPEVEANMPHFNWRRAELLPYGAITQNALKEEVNLLSIWQPISEWRRRILNGIRGEQAKAFGHATCGIPIRLSDNFRGILIFGPFNREVDLPKTGDFLRSIARITVVKALSWTQNLYLDRQRRESERSAKLIAHRVNNYLTHITGKFGTVKEEINRQQSDVWRAADQGERLTIDLASVVKNALDRQVSEMERSDYDFQMSSLPALVENCVEGVLIYAEREGKDLRIDDSIAMLPYAEVDCPFLSIALTNILENAVKYSYPRTYIKVSSTYTTREATITVQNLGEKMPDQARQNLLEPGRRWSERQSSIVGTGYGLWDAYTIVEIHEGKLDFSSDTYHSKYQNRDTYVVKVWITIPLKQSKR